MSAGMARNEPITKSSPETAVYISQLRGQIHSFAKFMGEESAARQGEEAHEAESKAGRGG